MSGASPAAPLDASAPSHASPTVPARPHTNRLLLYGLIAFAMLVWAFNYPVAKFAFRELDGLTIGSLRLVIAAVFMVPVHILWRRGNPIARALTAADYGILAALGFFVGFNQGLFIYGLSYTTVGHSALIIAIGPVNILLLAVFFGLERFTLNKVAGVVLAFTGVSLLAAGHGLGSRDPTLLGDVLTLLGSLAFAAYAIIGKHVTRRFDTLTLTAWPFYFGALFLSPVAVRQIVRTDWTRVGWIGYGALLYIGLGASLIGYLIWMWAMHHITASRMGIYTYVQPVLGTVIGVFLLGEPYTGWLAFSGVLVICGVGIAQWHPRGTESEEETPAVPD